MIQCWLLVCPCNVCQVMPLLFQIIQAQVASVYNTGSKGLTYPERKPTQRHQDGFRRI